MKSTSIVREINFEGLDAIELLTPKLRVVAVTAKGPRLAFWGRPGGKNLLYWAPGKHRRGDWDLMGGHRLWATRPGADETEETYAADNQPATVQFGRTWFTVTAAINPVYLTRRGFTVKATRRDRLVIDHFICNEGAALWSGGLWALTCTVPSARTTYTIPLGDGSSWDFATMIAYRTWCGGNGGVGFDDPQFRFTRDAFVLRPSGRENKRMLKADAGIIAWHDSGQKILFAKQTTYEPSGVYPLGTNLALYISPENVMVEMETMGPAVTLKPGQMLKHRETWLLANMKTAPTTDRLCNLF